jgi:putative membrane protein
MRVAWTITWLHVLALVLGLFGILVAIPHPELWAHDPNGSAIFRLAIDKTGGTAMALGALAMLTYGWSALGPRRTLLFFFAATVLSATAELIGTQTGWPFGGYEYTNFLGPKLLGRVPVAVPLSWFTMGFASLVLSGAFVAARAPRRPVLTTILLATWLLTAWDLVLDPSMAAPQMQYVHFWIWHESGPYFGMPLRNLAGWLVTGLAFIAIGRGSWNERLAPPVPLRLPFTVYAVNVAWSLALAVSAGMWPTALAGIALALIPAALCVRAAQRPAPLPAR